MASRVVMSSRDDTTHEKRRVIALIATILLVLAVAVAVEWVSQREGAERRTSQSVPATAPSLPSLPTLPVETARPVVAMPMVTSQTQDAHVPGAFVAGPGRSGYTAGDSAGMHQAAALPSMSPVDDLVAGPGRAGYTSGVESDPEISCARLELCLTP